MTSFESKTKDILDASGNLYVGNAASSTIAIYAPTADGDAKQTVNAIRTAARYVMGIPLSLVRRAASWPHRLRSATVPGEYPVPPPAGQSQDSVRLRAHDPDPRVVDLRGDAVARGPEQSLA